MALAQTFLDTYFPDGKVKETVAAMTAEQREACYADFQAVADAYEALEAEADIAAFDAVYAAILEEVNTALAAEPDSAALPKLDTPTELMWGKQYYYYILEDKLQNPKLVDYPGYICFKWGATTQYKCKICIYRVDGETETCVFSTQYIGSSDFNSLLEYESWSWFIEEDLGSGTYYFTITSLGDGTNYQDSDTAKSDTWTYTEATQSIGTPTNLSWDWPNVQWENPSDTTYVGGEDLAVYYSSTKDGERRRVGGRTGQSGVTTQSSVWEEYISQHGNGYWSFRVRLLTNNITQYNNSEWSEYSPVYHLGGCTTHSYKYTVTTAPTPAAKGVLTGTCSVCKETETITLPMLNATDYAYTETKAATCTATGTATYTWNTTTYGTQTFKVTLEKLPHEYDRVTGICTVCGQADGTVYTITYKLNSGTNPSGAPTSYVKGYGAALPTPTRTGYRFDGWYKESGFNNQITEISKEQTGKLTLYAKWVQVNGITYTWSGAPADVTLPKDDEEYDVGTELSVDTTFATGESTHSGVTYRFSGWYADADGDGELDSTEEPAGETVTMAKGGVQLVGRWSAVDLAVTYTWSGNIPSNVTAPTDTTLYAAGDTVTVKQPYNWKQVVENGGDSCAFYGWYVDANGNSQVDASERRAGASEKVPEGGLKLVAAWKKLVACEYAWAEGTPEGIQSGTDYALPEKTVSTPDSPSDEASATVAAYKGKKTYEDGVYTFAGWVDKDGTPVSAGDKLTESGTLYGTWTQKHTVTYAWSGNLPPTGERYTYWGYGNSEIDYDGTCPTESGAFAQGDTVALKEPYSGYYASWWLSICDTTDKTYLYYWFYGWYIDEDGDNAYSEGDTYVGESLTMPDKNVTVVGRWTKGYSVSYKWEEGTPEGITEDALGNYPLHVGYYVDEGNVPTTYTGMQTYVGDDGALWVFAGFYADVDGDGTAEKITSSTTMPSKDLTVYLRWEKSTSKVYTITYVMNGGTNSDKNPAYYAEGAELALENPTRENYEFLGWYTGSYIDGEGEKVTTLTGKAEDITLYAHWQAVTCTVEYDLDDSGSASKAMNNTANPTSFTVNSASVKLSKPTRVGYTFDGWYVNGEKVASIDYDPSGKITVVAQWTPIQYKLTFKNTLAGDDNPNDATFTVEGYTLEEPSRDGYDFEGWFYDAKYKKPVTDNKVPAGTVTKQTVYAKWKAHSYTVKFDRNAPDGVEITGKDMKDLTVTCGKTVKLTSCAFKSKDSSYVFTGWNTVPDGSGDSYMNKASILNLSKEDGAEITLYAQWKEKIGEYTIAFDSNCDDAVGEMKEQQGILYSKSVKLTANAFTRKGYTFNGWNTEADGSGVVYKNKASIKAICANSSNKVTLYAQWKLVTYKLSYTLNGGKQTGAPTSFTVETMNDVVLPEPTKTGYTFLGWYSTAKFAAGMQVTAADCPTKGTTVKLYARWRANEYRVIVNSVTDKDTDKTMVLDCTYGKSRKIPKINWPDSGWKFLYWVDAETGKIYKERASLKNLRTEDGAVVSLTPVWAKEEYTIHFAANGGKLGAAGAPKDVKASYGKSAKLSANTFVRDGYTFTGWNTEADGSGTAYKDKATVKLTAETESVTLYAQWVRRTPTPSSSTPTAAAGRA